MRPNDYPSFVEERLAGGGPDQRALCHICPLNGQRKVGHDGPYSSDYLALYEAPSEDEASDRLTRGYRYGRPLQGKVGYFVRVRHLASVGLQELLPPKREGGSPGIGRLHIHLMHTMMCAPPDTKDDGTLGPIGKKAERCCANSTRWFINKWLRDHPNGMLLPNGGAALSMLRGTKTPIEPYRGRPTTHVGSLAYEPEVEIEKAVFRGQKPQEEWWPDVESGLKHWSKYWRKVERTLQRDLQKNLDGQFLEANPWLTDWAKLWKKQKASLGRAAKRAATMQTGALREDTTKCSASALQ